MRPILSVRRLARILRTNVQTLRSLAENVTSHYRSWSTTDEATSKTRDFTVPDKQLKQLQARILRIILDKYSFPDFVHGGVKGKSPKSNASCHCATSLVVTLDIRQFFPSVSHRLVAQMFKSEFGCGREVTWLLTRLTTVGGQLPQGAPTSASIANVVLARSTDKNIQRFAQKAGVTVTRFVDDFAFSGAQAGSLVTITAKCLSPLNLSVGRNNAKLRFMQASQRQVVTGLTVNSPFGPSVPKTKRDRIKAAIHQLSQVSAAELPKALQSIRGRINYVAQFNRGSAIRLERQLDDFIENKVASC